jgi:hypothetical protein
MSRVLILRLATFRVDPVARSSAPLHLGGSPQGLYMKGNMAKRTPMIITRGALLMKYGAIISTKPQRKGTAARCFRP